MKGSVYNIFIEIMDIVEVVMENSEVMSTLNQLFKVLFWDCCSF